MISIKQNGNFDNITKYLVSIKEPVTIDILNRYGKKGVDCLKAATPVGTGNTANSWSYEIEKSKSGASIVFKNSHIVNGTPIAIILQYGHGTRNGGYVKGIDYINPAMKTLFENMSTEIWKEITNG